MPHFDNTPTQTLRTASLCLALCLGVACSEPEETTEVTPPESETVEVTSLEDLDIEMPDEVEVLQPGMKFQVNLAAGWQITAREATHFAAVKNGGERFFIARVFEVPTVDSVEAFQAFARAQDDQALSAMTVLPARNNQTNVELKGASCLRSERDFAFMQMPEGEQELGQSFTTSVDYICWHPLEKRVGVHLSYVARTGTRLDEAELLKESEEMTAEFDFREIELAG